VGNEVDRRRFLQGLAGAPSPIARRPLGRTGERVSILGLGGYHLGTMPSLQAAIALVQEAIDAGLTFFDNAWEYHDGRSEEWLGHALQGRRDEVFLMTKVCTHGRDGKVAMRQLEESLARLRTDHLDLWQIHEVIYENDPELHFVAGGVVDAHGVERKAVRQHLEVNRRTLVAGESDEPHLSVLPGLRHPWGPLPASRAHCGVSPK
jgi:aryl-alcohol dehydrogenase-like predicted oxidoreductase